MLRVLFIAYYFPPVGGAGVQRAQKFVQYLPTEGYLPVVITGPGTTTDRWTPRDQTLLRAIPKDVSVIRAAGPIPEQPSRLRGRLTSWLGVPGTFSKWWIESATTAARPAAAGTQLIFATMSPFESGEVARRLSRELAIPWVADLRDPWALDEMQVYPSRLHRQVDMWRMERLLSSAALIIMNTPESTAALKAAFPSLRRKEIITITNGYDAEDFSGVAPPRHDGVFRVVHAGYLHTSNGVRLRDNWASRFLGGAMPGVNILTRSHAVLLEAVERWCAERPSALRDLEIHLAGQTSCEDRDLVARSRVATVVRCSGYLSHEESVNLVRTSDLLFLPMHDLPSGVRSRIVPGKTYEYLASGRPILAPVPDGDARDYLEQSGAALICRPGDAATMARCLDCAYTAWQKGEAIVNPNHNFIRRFERRLLTRALADAFGRVVETGGRARQRGHMQNAILSN